MAAVAKADFRLHAGRAETGIFFASGLVVTGGLLATTGVALVAAGLIRSIEVGEAAPGTPQDRAPQYLALGGLGSLVAGGIVVLVGVALGETRVSVGP